MPATFHFWYFILPLLFFILEWAWPNSLKIINSGFLKSEILSFFLVFWANCTPYKLSSKCEVKLNLHRIGSTKILNVILRVILGCVWVCVCIYISPSVHDWPQVCVLGREHEVRKELEAIFHSVWIKLVYIKR